MPVHIHARQVSTKSLSTKHTANPISSAAQPISSFKILKQNNFKCSVNQISSSANQISSSANSSKE